MRRRSAGSSNAMRTTFATLPKHGGDFVLIVPVWKNSLLNWGAASTAVWIPIVLGIIYEKLRQNAPDEAFHVYWMLLFVTVPIVGVMVWWHAGGYERVEVRGSALLLELGLKGVAAPLYPRSFSLDRVENMRYSVEGDHNVLDDPRSRNMRGGPKAIAFDYDGSIVSFGIGLSKNEANLLVQAIVSSQD